MRAYSGDVRRVFVASALAFLTFFAAGARLRAEVRVSMHDGRVSLSAKDATLKDILEAWSAAGHTSFMHLDSVNMPERLTLELNDVSESDALALLLRPLSGYITVKRTAMVPNASAFDRVVLLPVSVGNQNTAVINTAATPPRVVPPPLAPQPSAPPPRTVIVNGVSRIVGPNGALVEDDQIDAPPPRAPQGFTRGDAPPQAPPTQQPPTSTPTPAPVGSSVPGVVTPPPAPAPANPPSSGTQR